MQEVVLAEPRKLDMRVGVIERDEDGNARTPAGFLEDEFAPASWPPCGTVGCIAGTLCVLSSRRPGRYFGEGGTQSTACRLLGIAENAWKEDHSLFFKENWPRPLQKRLARCRPGSAAYARVVCAAIDQWIEGDGGWPA